MHGDLKGVGLLDSEPLPISNTSYVKANILIDETCRACLADFGLVTIISSASSHVSSSESIHGGTSRWMSPELFRPKDFGLKDSRRTEYSDCYALGMVIYEVLSGQVPFSHHEADTAIVEVCMGGRPERPRGAEEILFTDVIWGVLERCWKPRREDRPSIKGVLQVLDEASRSWTPLSPLEGPPGIDPPVWSHSDPSTEENTGEDGVPPLSQAAPSRPSHTLLLRGGVDNNNIYPPDGSPVLFYDALDYQDLEASVEDPSRSGLEGFRTRWVGQALPMAPQFSFTTL